MTKEPKESKGRAKDSDFAEVTPLGAILIPDCQTISDFG